MKRLFALVAVPLFVCIACTGEPTGTGVLLADRHSAARAEADGFGLWAEPENLGPVVNSEFFDYLPALSGDGRSLYFSSLRPGGFGSADLWVTRRASEGGPWEEPVNLGPAINSPDVDAAPGLSDDGHWLYYSSWRPGGVGAFDIWVSWRADVHDDFAWQAPVNLGPGMNSPFFDAISFGHGREFYIASDRLSPLPAGNLDLFITRKRGRGFEAPVLVPELNSPRGEQAPSLRRDGRELFLTSNRAGSDGGSADIWTAYRQGVGRPWSPPVRVGAPVNTPFIDQQPVLSADGTTMIFTSNRPGGQGGLDLYVTRRERVR